MADSVRQAFCERPQGSQGHCSMGLWKRMQLHGQDDAGGVLQLDGAHWLCDTPCRSDKTRRLRDARPVHLRARPCADPAERRAFGHPMHAPIRVLCGRMRQGGFQHDAHRAASHGRIAALHRPRRQAVLHRGDRKPRYRLHKRRAHSRRNALHPVQCVGKRPHGMPLVVQLGSGSAGIPSLYRHR